ncbi:T9SS type A sorting domain-containing protein [bacterium]|nr:T9SS type A sorting domain-containing protein [bacterium]
MTTRRIFFTLFLISFICAPEIRAEFIWPASRVMQDLSPAQSSGDFSEWNFVSSPLLSQPVFGYGKPLSFTTSRSLSASALQVARELGCGSQFELLASNRAGKVTYHVFRETLDNLPIVCGRLDLVTNERNELARVSMRSFADWPVTGAHTWTIFSAASRLSITLAPASWQVVGEKSFSCWFPDVDAHTLRPAFWISLLGSAPHERHVGIVDANSGEILLDWSGIAHDVINLEVASPYWQPYNHSETQWAPCVNQNVVFNSAPFVTNSIGNVSAEVGETAIISASLTGPYVEVTNDDDGLISVFDTVMSAPFSGNQMTWRTDHATRPELNLWYHTEFIHDWYKIIDPAFNALDYPMPAVANVGSGYDNAYWNGWGTYYGSGATYDNFAMYSDVIYHEYTHGVTDGIYPDDMLPYIDQPGALNEAWSDYFACSINEDPLMGEWLTGSAHSAMRDLESNMIFPDNWGNEVHHDSPFISVPLWRLRNWLGVAYADSIAHFARYSLAETFVDYLQAVLEADDDDGDLSNGTPYGDQIYEAFGLSGIGPGLNPHFAISSASLFDDGLHGSIGNGNALPEASETLALVLTLTNDADLFPPPATNVRILLSSNDQALILPAIPQLFASIGPRESVDTAPFLIQVAGDAHDHWGTVEVVVECDQLSARAIKHIEFTIGIPRAIIVQKGSPQPVDSFVTRTLRDQDRIYRSFRVEETENFDLSFLPDSSLLIWLSGNADLPSWTQSEKTQIENYVNNGNFVVVSGKNIFSGEEGQAFPRDVFGVDIAPGFSMFRRAYSVAAPFITDEMFLLAGSGGASNQDSMTILSPLEGSAVVQRYATASGQPAGVLGPTGRTLAFGFGIEAISDSTPAGNSAPEVFMDRLYQWSGLLESASPEHPSAPEVNSLALQAAYPNPFNGSVNIAYSLQQAAQGRLIIRDILGRAVHDAMLHESSGNYLWQPSSASGIYFATLTSGNHVSNSVKLLYLR